LSTLCGIMQRIAKRGQAADVTQWPNLDEMSERDLLEFARVASIVREYAERRADARRARRDNRFKTALSLETRCHDLYEMLPAEARWRR
jgi:hypothetical protein